MAAVIIHKRRILLLKRRNLPIISNPGIWAFLTGARDGKERYIDTAYREIKEESGVGRSSLTPLKTMKVRITDKKRGLMWSNSLFIFNSTTGKVKLDYENSAYRWATIRQIENQINYTNTFINERSIIRAIKGCMHGKREPK